MVCRRLPPRRECHRHPNPPEGFCGSGGCRCPPHTQRRSSRRKVQTDRKTALPTMFRRDSVRRHSDSSFLSVFLLNRRNEPSEPTRDRLIDRTKEHKGRPTNQMLRSAYNRAKNKRNSQGRPTLESRFQKTIRHHQKK